MGARRSATRSGSEPILDASIPGVLLARRPGYALRPLRGRIKTTVHCGRVHSSPKGSQIIAVGRVRLIPEGSQIVAVGRAAHRRI